MKYWNFIREMSAPNSHDPEKRRILHVWTAGVGTFCKGNKRSPNPLNQSSSKPKLITSIGTTCPQDTSWNENSDKLKLIQRLSATISWKVRWTFKNVTAHCRLAIHDRNYVKRDRYPHLRRYGKPKNCKEAWTNHDDDGIFQVWAAM